MMVRSRLTAFHTWRKLRAACCVTRVLRLPKILETKHPAIEAKVQNTHKK